jgi:hypothetical protein
MFGAKNSASWGRSITSAEGLTILRHDARFAPILAFNLGYGFTIEKRKPPRRRFHSECFSAGWKRHKTSARDHWAIVHFARHGRRSKPCLFPIGAERIQSRFFRPRRARASAAREAGTGIVCFC